MGQPADEVTSWEDMEAKDDQILKTADDVIEEGSEKESEKENG